MLQRVEGNMILDIFRRDVAKKSLEINDRKAS